MAFTQLLRTIPLVGLATLAACGAPVAEIATPLTAPPPVAVATVPEGPPPPLEVLDPGSASTIQVCTDSADGDHAARLLKAIADHLEAVVRVDNRWVSAMYVEAWATTADTEAGGLLFEGVIPDIRDVTITAGLPPEQAQAQLEQQAEQRLRIPRIYTIADDVITQLRQVEVPASTTSDVFRCISRANERMAGRDPARRLLIVASTFPVGSGQARVSGDLSQTRLTLAFGWGADLARRSEAWQPTWESLGATPSRNLQQYAFDDGLGLVLRDAIAGLVPS